MSHLAVGHLVSMLFIVCGQKSTEVICHAVILLWSAHLVSCLSILAGLPQGMMGKFNRKRTRGVQQESTKVDFLRFATKCDARENKLRQKRATKTPKTHFGFSLLPQNISGKQKELSGSRGNVLGI